MHLPFYSYILIGLLSDDLEFAHPAPCIFFIADQVFGEDHSPYKEPEFPYLIILSVFSISSSFLSLS